MVRGAGPGACRQSSSCHDEEAVGIDLCLTAESPDLDPVRKNLAPARSTAVRGFRSTAALGQLMAGFGSPSSRVRRLGCFISVGLLSGRPSRRPCARGSGAVGG